MIECKSNCEVEAAAWAAWAAWAAVEAAEAAERRGGSGRGEELLLGSI